MNLTAGAVIVIAAIVIVGILIFCTKSGKRVRLRMSGTADEVISKDASTPEGAKAYYNVAIEKKQNDYNAANNLLKQIEGKKAGFEDQLHQLQKIRFDCVEKLNQCIDSNNDDGAKLYIKEQQNIDDKVKTLKAAIKDIEKNEQLQKETVESLEAELNDLKAEKDNAIFTLSTAQVTQSLQANPGTSSNEEDKMLEKVRDGIQKKKEEADGNRIMYENSTYVQKQRLEKKMKDDEVDRKLQELKAKKGK